MDGPLGLEQGVTIAAPPRGPSEGPLTLAFTLGGNLTATRDLQGEGLTLTGGGAPALRYTGLTALDATGRALPAWLDLQGNTLHLRMEAAGARYPIVVDPFIQLAKLTASDGGGDDFGFAVAISGDTVGGGAPPQQHPRRRLRLRQARGRLGDGNRDRQAHRLGRGGD